MRSTKRGIYPIAMLAVVFNPICGHLFDLSTCEKRITLKVSKLKIMRHGAKKGEWCIKVWPKVC